MASDKENIKAGITPEKALAWIERKLGKKTAKEIADQQGKSDRTIRGYIADFDEFIRGSEEFQKIGNRVVEMIPKALDVYDEALITPVTIPGSPAVRVADNILKICGVLIDRRQTINDNLDSMSDDELLNELGAIIESDGSEPESGDDDNTET